MPEAATTPPVQPSAAPASGPGTGFAQTHRDWLMLQAYLHLEQGKSDAAALLLRVLQRQCTDDGEVLRCLALAELLAGHPAEAARAATRALRQTPESLRTPVGLVFARALWDQGRHDSAREFLASLLTPVD